MKKQCAFLTMEDIGDFFVYDQLTLPHLENLGWTVTDEPWSKPAHDWSHYDVVVIRSPWDYQSSPAEFLQTLNDIEQSGARLMNSLEVCRWNLDKVYLRDLANRGVPTIPTDWFDCLNHESARTILETATNETPIVLKPTIGAGADGVFVLHPGEQEKADEAVAEYAAKPVMVQPFLRSIFEGEYSLFYFGGQYSHAILKRPRDGDFRVQEEHGGEISSVTPSEQLRSVADGAMAAIGETLLYGRVDIVMLNDGSPAVIELELIEPSLYFRYDEQSPQRFAEALEELWNGESLNT